MLLKDLKSTMLLPEKEILINKTLHIRGNNVHLISLTLEKHRKVLWVMYEDPYYTNKESDIDERYEYITNRDKMTDRIIRQTNSYHFSISELMIQNQKITFSLSSASYMNYSNYEGYMQMQHFIEKGLDLTNWSEVDLSNLVIASYVLNENEEFPLVDLSKNLDITLKVMRDFKQVLIKPRMDPISVEFGGIEEDNKFYFYDCNNKNITFYINKLSVYDAYEELNKQFEAEWAKAFPNEEIERMKRDLLRSLPTVCPEGMDLALLQYECENNIQLNFYPKEYLDETPVLKSSSVGLSIGFKPDEEYGPCGFKNRICDIKPVEKDFKGSIDVELFSYYMEIPEEIIDVKVEKYSKL